MQLASENTVASEVFPAASEALPLPMRPSQLSEGTGISPWNSGSDGNMCLGLRHNSEGLRGSLRKASSSNRLPNEGLSVRWSDSLIVRPPARL